MKISTCLVALALATAGCSGPAATAAGSASASATLTTSFSPEESGGSSPPSMRPTDPLPLPAGFPVHESMVSTEASPGATAAWTTDASPQVVYAYYVANLPVAGFEIDLEAPGGGAAVIRFHDADGTAYQLDFVGAEPLMLTLGAPHP